MKKPVHFLIARPLTRLFSGAFLPSQGFIRLFDDQTFELLSSVQLDETEEPASVVSCSVGVDDSLVTSHVVGYSLLTIRTITLLLAPPTCASRSLPHTSPHI